MMRNLVLGCGLAACGLFALGCDGASSAKRDPAAEEAAAKARAEQERKAREEPEVTGTPHEVLEKTVVKPIREALPKIEEKIKTMSGEAQAKAKEKLADVKRRVEEIPNIGLRDLSVRKDELEQAFKDLKAQVGM